MKTSKGMKMKTIRISEEVWAAMAFRGKFGETPDDVLRRVLIGDTPGRKKSNASEGSQECTPNCYHTGTPTAFHNSTSVGTLVGTPSTMNARPLGWKERRAKVTLTQRQEGNDLVLRFAGGAERRFPLPPRSEKTAIRQLRDEAVSWARQNGATDGQQGAVMRALTSRGFHITK